MDWLASQSSVAMTVIILDLLWVAFSARFEYPTRLETVFQTMVAAVTLAMVFVIQHTQARQQAVAQRKLDEILRALPGTDKSLITLESARTSRSGRRSDDTWTPGWIPRRTATERWQRATQTQTPTALGGAVPAAARGQGLATRE